MTPWTAARQASLSFSISRSLCKLISMIQWYHPTISSSVALFSSYPQSFPASESFPMSQLFTSSAQSTGASALASVHPTDIQGWFHLGLTGLILLSKGLSRFFSQHHGSKASILWSSAFFMEAMEVMGRGNLSHYNGLCLSKGPQYINKCTVSTSLSNIKTSPANLHLLVIKLRLLPTPNPPFCHPL